MTTEEKAKAYDKAIERAKNYYSTTDSVADTELIELIFPELKESEDEKIRKEMISWLKGFIGEEEGCGYTEDEIRERIAWLEKQGKQKPQRMVSAEAKEAMYDKPAWSEEDEERLSDAIFFVREYQIPTRDKRGYLMLQKETEDWLRTFKERVQPKQEWSEEDENNISILEALIYNDCNAEDASRLITWLKSLKERVQPQPQPKPKWKPSEEQMDALEDAIADAVSSIQKNMLNSLYQDLQKLR